MVLVAVVTFSSSVWAVETLIGGCGLEDMFPYYEWNKFIMIVNRVCTKMFMLLEQCHYVTTTLFASFFRIALKQIILATSTSGVR